MKECQSVKAQVYNQGSQLTQHTWELPKSTLIQHSSVMEIIEEDTLEIPMSRADLEKQFFLVSYDSKMVVEDFSNQISKIMSDSALYGKLQFSKLRQGYYKLFSENGSITHIKVHKGVCWSENPNFILKQHSLIERIGKDNSILIHSVKIEEAKDKKKQIKIQISSKKPEWRAHVLFFRYLPQNLLNLTSQLLSQYGEQAVEHHFQKWENYYASNRSLSTEFRYCFDRRYRKRFTGNTLEKPTLLLRRCFIEETTTEKEILKQGSGFEEELMDCSNLNCPPPDVTRSILNRVAPSSMTSVSKTPTPVRDQSIQAFQNFLAIEPVTLYNLSGDSYGNLVVEIDETVLQNFGSMLVIAASKGAISHHLQPLPCSSEVLQDLTLHNPFDSTKFYSEMRTTTFFLMFSNYHIF